MTTYADTGLMRLQQRVHSLTGKRAYDMDAETCREVIAQHDARDALLVQQRTETLLQRVFGVAR